MALDASVAVLRALADGAALTSGELAEITGISRQGLHRHLRRLLRAGSIVASGRGRSTRYRLAPKQAAFEATLPTLGLAEDRLWSEVLARVPELSRPEYANAVANTAYAFTEMVNNVIDHAEATSVTVTVAIDAGRLRFEVRDDGVGVFENVRAKLELPDRLAALQEVSKGKTTTAPERHSGEGLFFTSKVADQMEVEANGLKWSIDNERDDIAVSDTPELKGTTVRFEIRLDKRETLESVFARYTHDFVFDTTKTIVKLFTYGVRFVSRSEAKRLLNNLDRFKHVVIDFTGVEGVGQGFADEIFRVWSRAHPQIELATIGMSPAVAFMVERARRAG